MYVYKRIVMVGSQNRMVLIDFSCCPWCTCGDTLKLKLPWQLDCPPTVWDEADWKGTGRCPDTKNASLLLSKICKHPFPTIPLIFEWAHKALPGEDLPRKCRVCKRRSFETVAAYAAAQQTWAERRSDTTRQGKAKFLNDRSKHAASHFSQYLFEVPPFLIL